MTDEEKMKLARECAARTFDARSIKFPNSVIMERYHAKVIRQCEGDDYDAVQSALAAINALAPRLEEAEKLLREISEQSDGIVQRLADRDMSESDAVWCKLFAAYRDSADAFLYRKMNRHD